MKEFHCGMTLVDLLTLPDGFDSGLLVPQGSHRRELIVLRRNIARATLGMVAALSIIVIPGQALAKTEADGATSSAASTEPNAAKAPASHWVHYADYPEEFACIADGAAFKVRGVALDYQCIF